jgi:hypothetical protein
MSPAIPVLQDQRSCALCSARGLKLLLRSHAELELTDARCARSSTTNVGIRISRGGEVGGILANKLPAVSSR